MSPEAKRDYRRAGIFMGVLGLLLSLQGFALLVCVRGDPALALMTGGLILIHAVLLWRAR